MPATDATREFPWWREALFYQIYPRSFQDSDGDGIGDLPGIAARLDHLASLNIDAVWLSPHFDSPNADNGYDIRDYRRVMDAFGTMADFDALLAGLTERNIRLVLDLVVNHTSDEHEWFRQSRQSRDDPYRDFYIWRDGRGDEPPNNYPSFFGGPAWTRDEATGQWYLHLFGTKQPDLNWDNPRVREEVFALMRFWLDKGVSGFRMDVIPLISKQPGLPDLTTEELRAPERVYAAGPKLHDYLREMHARVLAPYRAVSIGEALGLSPEGILDLVDERRGELALAFTFDIARIGRDGWRQGEWTLPEWKALFARFDGLAGAHAWNCVFLENHDSPRSLAAFGDPDPAWRERASRVLATLVLTQRGTPFLYQGQEIGINNYPFAAIRDYEDVEARGQWQDFVETGRVEPNAFLAMLARTSRDNARTPMQWTAQTNAGFTGGEPWLPVNPDFAAGVNVADESNRAGSVLEHVRAVAALRRQVPDLRRGDYADLLPDDPALFAYRRGAHLVALNMNRAERRFALPEGGWNLVLASDPAAVRLENGSLRLGGWEAAILEPA